MGRHKANDPDYKGRKIRIPHDFFAVISSYTECIHEDLWRIHDKGYYKKCLAIAKVNQLLIWDIDADIIF